MKRESFHPNVFIDISATIDDKLNAMKMYETEIRTYPHPRSIKAMRISAQYFGNTVGIEYAEPFKLIYSK